MGLQIKKLDNGQVRIYSTTKERPEYYDPQAVLKYSQGGGAVGVYYSGRLELDLFPDQVESYQIGDAGAVVPFSGDVKALMDILGQSFFFPSVAGEGALSGGEVVLNNSYKILGITSATLVDSLEMEEGFTYAVEVVGLSQRGTLRTGSYIKRVRHFGRTSAGSIASTEQTVFNAASYSVVPTIDLNGNSIEIFAGVAGAIPINWNITVKILKIENT